jgi:hypothetical protein
LATPDLTLAIATFIWTRLPCARYDRLIPFLFLILIGRLAILDTWSIQASYMVDSSLIHGRFKPHTWSIQASYMVDSSLTPMHHPMSMGSSAAAAGVGFPS